MNPTAISQQLKALHSAFNRQDSEALQACYTSHAHVVSSPLAGAHGHPDILSAMEAFRARYADEQIVSQGDEVIVEAGDVALVMSKIYLTDKRQPDQLSCEPVEAVYVFKQNDDGQWRCAVDNFFGVDLLNYC